MSYWVKFINLKYFLFYIAKMKFVVEINAYLLNKLVIWKYFLKFKYPLCCKLVSSIELEKNC